ncbi:MAG: phosphotransferase [Rubripirellula sp.]
MQTSPFPMITLDDADTIQYGVEQLGLCDGEGERVVRVERAGEGNMNSVLRVTTTNRSVILKQSRPWVEKYPEIAAPADRILAEIDFYQRVQLHPSVCRAMPRLLAASQDLHLMAMEDLGEATDYSDLYARFNADELPLQDAVQWLVQLHSISVPECEQSSVGNLELRALNHAHIFQIPLQSPSVLPLDDICDGMESVADSIRTDRSFQTAAERLGSRYLGTGPCLLHGDFYPGSWLRTKQGLRVIDPEFTFAGPAEFDLAMIAAHRVLMGGLADSVALVTDAYSKAGGRALDARLMSGFAGMEIMRRLLGVAQLPLESTLRQRMQMLSIARDYVA